MVMLVQDVTVIEPFALIDADDPAPAAVTEDGVTFHDAPVSYR